jgi:hypothetical protein
LRGRALSIAFAIYCDETGDSVLEIVVGLQSLSIVAPLTAEMKAATSLMVTDNT